MLLLHAADPLLTLYIVSGKFGSWLLKEKDNHVAINHSLTLPHTSFFTQVFMALNYHSSLCEHAELKKLSTRKKNFMRMERKRGKAHISQNGRSPRSPLIVFSSSLIHIGSHFISRFIFMRICSILTFQVLFRTSSSFF